ncbi:LysM peptidoglycan-binding domain-containing protein [Caloramator sp. CAR-1]|uniref:LysM peptidoglycan-binding domain-containing protein n=1 Tax=Caloramator sp. CAR-1 TaxID=3062777 RepID=UPI0026E14630|nr:LysM peptidoglycan-binding domain-containing protein [Caloramator sp. CAR-1]MDO6353980.1 LysM peptidoglycan-binding domain-containing protein [Caloramator sp. CAR-1]
MLRKKLLFIAVIVAFSTITIISINFRTYSSKNQEIYIKYTVKTGDTLWSIAKKYTDGDPRRLIYEIRKHNDISPIIRPGQVIEVPILNK